MPPTAAGLPAELLQQYDIARTLGHGGFAKVKLARHRARLVAVTPFVRWLRGQRVVVAAPRARRRRIAGVVAGVQGLRMAQGAIASARGAAVAAGAARRAPGRGRLGGHVVHGRETNWH